MNLTAKQTAFMNIYKENPNLDTSKIMYILDKGSLEGYEKLSNKEISLNSNRGLQIKKALHSKGIYTDLKKIKGSRDKAIAKEVKELANTINEHKGKVDGKKLIENFVENVNHIIDKTKFKTEEQMNKVEKEAFTDNSLMLYDMIDIGQLKAANTKEEQIKILTAMVHYSTSIERNLYGTDETGYTSKSYMRHPQVAFQCIKLICELTGTLQTTTNVNIQINNILQEIEQKRLKELTTEDSLVVDDKVIK